MPCTCTRGLRFSRTIASVFSSCTRPRSERYSHCTGTITPSAATKALIVEQTERRRRVDEDVVVAVAHLDERLVERALAADERGQGELGPGQVDRRDGDVHLDGLDDVGDRDAMDEHVEHRALDRVGVHALAHGQVALGIEVDDEDAAPLFVERHAEVERRRRLRDAALLVRERDDLRHQRASRLGGRRRCWSGRRDGLQTRRLIDRLDRHVLDGLGDRLGTRLETRKET